MIILFLFPRVMYLDTNEVFPGCPGDSGGPVLDVEGALTGVQSFNLKNLPAIRHTKDYLWRHLGCEDLSTRVGFVITSFYRNWIMETNDLFRAGEEEAVVRGVRRRFDRRASISAIL